MKAKPRTLDAFKNADDSISSDVFRRTGMKITETEQQKQHRLKRCFNVLKQVNAGEEPRSFKPMQGIEADPRSIDWQDREGDISDTQSDITMAELVVLDKGKKRLEESFV